MQLDFFYDLSSPWTYLAFNNIQPIIKETGAAVRWRPFLVGGVFNAVNPGVYEARAIPTDPKVIHNFRWLHEWARLADLPLVFPTEHHPVKSVLAMRVCCALEPQQQALQLFSAAAFDAYFAEGNNIDDPAVLARVADSCGLDGNSLIEQASQQSIKINCAPIPRRRLRLAPTDHPLCLSLTSFISATTSYPLSGTSYCVGRVTNPRSSRPGDDPRVALRYRPA
jgi:2-hydroxychromene-2-carboxylate isomerase